MSKSWATKRWILAVAAAAGLLGLVLKISEISRPGRGKPAEQHAAMRPARPAERHAAAPSPGGSVDWPSAGLAPDAAPDEEVRKPVDTTRSLPLARSTVRHAEGGARDDGGAHELGGHLHRSAGAGVASGRRQRADGLQTAVVGDSGNAAAPAAGGGRSMNELRAPQGAATQTPGAVPPAEVPPGSTDVAFDSGETTQYPTDTQVEVPDVKKITGGAGTMSFWLQPGWDEGNHDDATFVQLGDSRLQVIKNVNFLRFEFLDDNGIPGGIGAPIAEWKAGEWHQVTTTWNGGQFSMYLDGQLVSQTVHDGRVDLTPDTKLFIGSDFPESRPVAPGVIGKVDLQNRPLSPGEVANRYQSATGQKNAGAPPPARH